MSDSLWPPWAVTCQAPLSMGLSRQEHLTRILAKEWAAISSGDLPYPEIKPWSPALQADSILWVTRDMRRLPFFFFFFASFGGAENEQWYLVPGSVKYKYRSSHFFKFHLDDYTGIFVGIWTCHASKAEALNTLLLQLWLGGKEWGQNSQQRY